MRQYLFKETLMLGLLKHHLQIANDSIVLKSELNNKGISDD